MLVTELKDEKEHTFEGAVLDMIPNICPTCGLPLVINPTFTGLSCINDKCVSKVSRRCVAMLSTLGFLGLGDAAMEQFCNEFGITCPTLLYMLEPEDLATLPDSAYKRNLESLATFLQANSTMKLANYVALANLPGVQLSTTEKLFAGFDDLDTFYRTLDVEGITFIKEQLGIKGDTSLKSIKVYETLNMYKEELTQPLEANFITLELPSEESTPLTLVISDDAGPQWQKKKDFMDEVINRYKGTYDITFKGSVTKQTDILIWAGGRYTSKVQKAERFEIPIVDGFKFIQVADTTADKTLLVNTLYGG